MTNRALWGAIVLLGLACGAEGAYIVENREAGPGPVRGGLAKPASRPDDLDVWQKRIQREIAQDGRIAERDFDDIFNDDFFRRVDPFNEIEKVQQQLERRLATPDRDLFSTAFDHWFHERLGLTGIDSSVKDEGKTVSVTYEIPGLESSTVKVDVNEARIRLTCDAKKTEKGKFAKAVATERLEKIMPVPPDADPTGFQVKKGKDELTLMFKKTPARL